MEALLFRMIVVAFSLLTVALISGSIYSEEIFGKPLTFDHKTLFAFISWGILQHCWSAATHGVGEENCPCAGRWRDSWCSCSPTSAAASSSKSFSGGPERPRRFTNRGAP